MVYLFRNNNGRCGMGMGMGEHKLWWLWLWGALTMYLPKKWIIYNFSMYLLEEKKYVDVIWKFLLLYFKVEFVMRFILVGIQWCFVYKFANAGVEFDAYSFLLMQINLNLLWQHQHGIHFNACRLFFTEYFIVKSLKIL